MKNKPEKNHIFLHLGLVKTGSTFLQKEIFPKLDVNYYHKPDLLTENFIGHKILISKEEWCHTKYIANHPELLDFDFIALERLSKIFPNAKIILGMRKEGFEKSLYSRFLLEGSTLSFDEFKKRLNKRFLNQNRYVTECKKMFSDVFIYTLDDLKKNPQTVADRICNFMNVPKIIINGNRKYNTSLKPMQQKSLRMLNNLKFKKIPGFHTLFNRYIRPL